jgi:hypothetical protein
MDLSNPASAVVPSLDASVLTVLAGTTRPLTGREVARLAERSQRGVQTILTRMADHGLLDVADAGPARLYTVNREHVAATAALALLDLRGQLFERIRRALAAFPVPPVAAAVFGSAARGDGDATSDVDVFVVRRDGVEDSDPRWNDSVDMLAQAIHRWSGNYASIIQATPEQVAAMVDRAEPIISDLRRDAVALTAQEILGVVPNGAR